MDGDDGEYMGDEGWHNGGYESGKLLVLSVVGGDSVCGDNSCGGDDEDGDDGPWW